MRTHVVVEFAPVPASVPVRITQITALGAALARFNKTFDRTLALPIWPEHVEAAAELADMRGRNDIADELRAALEAEL